MKREDQLARKSTANKMAVIRHLMSLKWIGERLSHARAATPTRVDPHKTEDEIDADIARKRISEIEESPDKLVQGDELKKRLARLGG